MKNNYLLPRQNVVEIDEEEMLCTSPQGDTPTPLKVGLSDYGTYEEKSTPRKDPNSVDWDGVGTGSDF